MRLLVSFLGPPARPAVSRMHSEFTEAGDPQPREGFASVLVSGCLQRSAGAWGQPPSGHPLQVTGDAPWQEPLCAPRPPQALPGLAPPQICESDGDVAAALDAWVLFGPAHADPAAEYARLRPPPPPPPVLNTLDRYFKKGSSGGASGSGGGTGSKNKAAGPAAAPAGGKQQQQQQPGTGPAAAAAAAAAGGGGGPAAAPAGGSGASKVDAFKLLMSPKPHPPANAPPAKAGPSGGSGGGGSRHTWKAGGPFANSLTKIAADPERHGAGVL